MNHFVELYNTTAWVGANLLVAYIALTVPVFVIAYYMLFDPRATTGGKLIFRFFLSLVGIILLVFVGTYIDPTAGRDWWTLPPDVEWWRPTARLVGYGYVAFTITSLSVYLARRKWWPQNLKTAPEKDFVRPRSDTTENPVIK